MTDDKQALTLVGRTLGVYKIVAHIGSGGMGDVYRATDTRLGRDVALKVLHTDHAGDSLRLSRFQREAQAVSALNHPNILSVYDVGTVDGVAFIVSELIDGPSLRRTLDQAPVQVKALLTLAVQIADGLTAAHDAGVVHRDLKPENIMVTKDGRVKIVDFGLAQSAAPLSADDAGAHPTRTEEGLIVGTVPYMSPEQARGAPVDFRSDQFSFGLILYELATGAQPFRRETPVQTLSAIITDEPAAICTINPRMPAPFMWVVERCLAKPPHGRYASTLDLARDLHTIRDRLAEATAVNVTAADTGHSRRRAAAAFVAVAVGSAAAALLAFAALADPPTIDLSAARLTPLAGELMLETGPVWSPDGKQVAYVGEVNGVTQLFTRRLDSPRSSQLTYEAFGVRYPFWSSDMSGVYFIRQAGFREGLFWVSTVSGQAVSVQQNVASAALSRDGRTLAMFREEEGRENSQAMWIASPPDADPVRYTQPPFDKALFSVTMLQFSPDDRKIGVWAQGTAGSGGYGSNPSNTRFWIVPWPSGTPYEATAFSRLPPSWPFFSWYSDSRHVIVPRIEPPSGSHLWWMDTESDAGQRIDLATANTGSLDVRPGGETIAFSSNSSEFDLVEVPLDGSALRPLLATPRNEQEPAWSPSGGHYAYVTDRNGNSQIWKRSLDGRAVNEPLVTERDFPDEPSFLFGAPVFSTDGERIAYDRQGAYNRIYISPVAGGQPVPVTSEKYFVSSPTWAPDGTSIGFVALFDGKWELQRSDVGRPSSNLKLRGAIVPYTQPRWSPDARWIAVLSTDPNGLVLVSPDPKSATPEVLLSEETGWLVFGWSKDSQKLYGIRNLQGRMVLVSIDVHTRQEKVINRDLGLVPLSDVPVRGFSWMTPTSFSTSIVRVSARIWLLEGFRPPLGRFERLFPSWLRR